MDPFFEQIKEIFHSVMHVYSHLVSTWICAKFSKKKQIKHTSLLLQFIDAMHLTLQWNCKIHIPQTSGQFF